jgi:PAS domain S-box-containing protein
MNKELRVLVIEDSEKDTLLLMRELEDAGYNPAYWQADSAAAMTSALEQQPWDIVICDHSMPGFDSTEALGILRAKDVDIPFIVVSGTIGEDFAVDMMKAGANDYVMKGSRARLLPSIERELREAENRRERRQTEAALAYLAAIVESSEDAIIGTSLDGTILSWNSGAQRLYGYTAAEAKGRSISMLSASSPPEEFLDVYEQIERGELIARYQTVRARKDGTPLDVSLTLSPIKGAAGKVVGVSVIEHDISATKREEKERLKLIQELTDALAGIRTLRGLLPICASCKKIRDDQGYWQKVESYLAEHTNAEFTHGLCPDCLTHLYPASPREKQASKG